jgi:trimeric autotransporter adhesin
MNRNLNLAFASLVSLFFTLPATAQTTLFSDNFNRAALTVSAPTTYTTTVTAGDGGASIVASDFLRLTNDATTAGNASGRVFVTGATSSFTSFQQSLASNTSTLEWSFNAKSNRNSDPGGFGAGNYSLAVVLGASGSDLTTANGYAIAYGNSGAPDPIRLVKFAGGLDADANLTTMISSGAADLSGFANYFSVKVRYTPSTDSWQLFVRDDGASGWSDPSTSSAQIGSTVMDSTYTSTPLTHFGFGWNYNSAASQSAQFDNFTLNSAASTSAPEPSTLLLLLAGFGIISSCLNLKRRHAS